MKFVLTAIIALALAGPASAASWTLNLGSEASVKVIVAESGYALGVGQIAISGGTLERFNKVTSPIVTIPGINLPLPNPLAIVRPAFAEAAPEVEVAK